MGGGSSVWLSFRPERDDGNVELELRPATMTFGSEAERLRFVEAITRVCAEHGVDVEAPDFINTTF